MQSKNSLEVTAGRSRFYDVLSRKAGAEVRGEVQQLGSTAFAVSTPAERVSEEQNSDHRDFRALDST